VKPVNILPNKLQLKHLFTSHEKLEITPVIVVSVIVIMIIVVIFASFQFRHQFDC